MSTKPPTDDESTHSSSRSIHTSQSALVRAAPGNSRNVSVQPKAAYGPTDSENPYNGAIAVVLLGLIGIFIWPRSASRPVAVYPLKWRVVMEGAPLAQATVVLHPTGTSKLPSGILPRATAEVDGGLVFNTFDPADGTPEGEFVATVHLMKPVIMDGDLAPGPDLSPAVYRTPETSPFRVTITRETREISVLELHNSARGTSIHN